MENLSEMYACGITSLSPSPSPNIFIGDESVTYEKIMFGNIDLIKIIDDHKTHITELNKKVSKLEELVNQLWYAPNGVGYTDAKQRFELSRKNMSRKKEISQSFTRLVSKDISRSRSITDPSIETLMSINPGSQYRRITKKITYNEIGIKSLDDDDDDDDDDESCMPELIFT
jgi:hypothetical protein